MEKRYYKRNKSDKIWWLDTSGYDGLLIFSFDKKTDFNLFADYPHNLTAEQIEIFNNENPFWRAYFKSRGCGQKPGHI